MEPHCARGIVAPPPPPSKFEWASCSGALSVQMDVLGGSREQTDILIDTRLSSGHPQASGFLGGGPQHLSPPPPPPPSSAIETLKAMLSQGGSESVSGAMTEAGGWELLRSPDTHYDGVAFLAR